MRPLYGVGMASDTEDGGEVQPTETTTDDSSSPTTAEKEEQAASTGMEIVKAGNSNAQETGGLSLNYEVRIFEKFSFE